MAEQPVFPPDGPPDGLIESMAAGVVPPAPPHSVEVEQSLLGGLMLNPKAWFDVADFVSQDDFYRKQHQLLWHTFAALAMDGEPVDGVTVSNRLRDNGALEDVGGLAYLAELAENTPAAGNVRAYAAIVRDKATTRRLIEAANHIAEVAADPRGMRTPELLNYAEQQVFRIHDDRSARSGPQPVLPLLEKTVRRVEELYATKNPVTGLATGFTELDLMTAGLQKGSLVIVAARPSMGKTSLAMNIVEHALMQPDVPGAVLVFNMEMPAESLMLRMLSSLGRIDASRARVGDLKDDDWPRLTNAVALLQDKPLLIDDTAALTPNDVRTRARRVAREHEGGIKLVVIDYLQLMSSSQRQDNRTLEISEISRSLKLLAGELDCPVIALSQLNRSVEQRNDKRPQMSDLRESGAIEEDADVILFIYRDEIYNKDSLERGKAELIVSKQRNGPIGMVKTAFIGSLTRFENLADDSYESAR